ncbi:MAG: 50S ribosomal protein L21 [Clostridia bacterium]|nr:50S ribosomal protein L21 [Clostridia bacterium]MDE7256670.1 50S ribosomal protein L21 [Clostridia bacterium]
MYAIFDNGNKQYKVSVGDTVKVEKLDAQVGATVTFPVVMTADDNGAVAVGSEVEKVVVTAEVTGHGKDKKIIVFKYKAKKNERKKQGHRQPYSTVKVTAIGAAEAKKKAPAKKAEPVADKAEKTEAPAAPKKRATKKAVEAPAAE